VIRVEHSEHQTERYSPTLASNNFEVQWLMLQKLQLLQILWDNSKPNRLALRRLRLFDANYNLHGNGNPNNDKHQIAEQERSTKTSLTTANGKFCFVRIDAICLSWKRKTMRCYKSINNDTLISIGKLPNKKLVKIQE
jgi:hypothetical protein